jgi:hypothetical protein
MSSLGYHHAGLFEPHELATDIDNAPQLTDEGYCMVLQSWPPFPSGLALQSEAITNLRRLVITQAGHPQSVDLSFISSLLHVTSVSGSGRLPPNALAAFCALPRLMILDLRLGALTDQDARDLCAAPALQKLTLCAAQLSKEFVRTLAPSTSLTKLSFAGCGLRLEDLDCLALYNFSLVRVDFFAMSPTCALGYHLATARARAAERRRDLLAKLYVLAHARRLRACSRLCALPTDLLVLIIAATPAPPLAKYPPQLAGCAHFVLTSQGALPALVPPLRVMERKGAHWKTLKDSVWSW